MQHDKYLYFPFPRIQNSRCSIGADTRWQNQKQTLFLTKGCTFVDDDDVQ